MPSREFFVLTLAAAGAVCDLVTGKISNMIVIAGWAAGLFISIAEALSPEGVSGAGWLALNRHAAAVSAASFAAGALLPLAAGFLLFRFRMFGAGDVKLLSAIGGLTGIRVIPRFLFVCLLTGAAVAVLVMLFCTGVKTRLKVLAAYVAAVYMQQRALPYRTFENGEEKPQSGGGRAGRNRAVLRPGGLRRHELSAGEFHFTIPVLMTAILYAGGLL